MPRMQHIFLTFLVCLLFVVSCVPAFCLQLSAEAQQTLDSLRTIVDPVSWSWRYKVGDFEGGQDANLDDSAWEAFNGTRRNWGDAASAWLRTTVTVPDRIGGISVDGSEVKFICSIDDGGTLYVDGDKKSHWIGGHSETTLTENAKPGRVFHIAIQGINTGGPGILLDTRIRYSVLDGVRDGVQTFLNSYKSAEQFYEAADENKRGSVLGHFEQSLASVDAQAAENGDTDRFVQSLSAAADKLQPIHALANDITIHLVGHAHIDMNWLWLWPETVDTCRRTFSTAATLMDEYPGFVFSQSQPAVYCTMEQDAPEVYARIKEKIDAGQWDAIGSTWVEGDTNMSSGESLVRSILYGKRYMKKHFGVDTNVCWEPDTFGHVWTLPQILAKSGMKYYYFMRAGKDQPLFWWQSPDGSRVLAYNYGSYNNGIDEAMALDAMRFTNKTGVKDFMRVYGVGDHGGGPTRQMIDKALELESRDDYPDMKFSTVSAYFDKVAASGKDFPVINDELNTVFEGCYTTHSDAKRWNRRSEHLLGCAEKLSAIASAQFRFTYPVRDFENSWRNTCFNQFHDILCGSAIHGSYDYSRGLFEEAESQGKTALNNAIDVLERRITTSGQEGVPVIVFNSLSWTRTDVVEAESPFPGEDGFVKIMDEDGNVYAANSLGDRLIFTARDVPAMGYRVFWARRADKPVSSGVRGNGTTIENQFFRVTIDKEYGVIRSIYDKVVGRHVMPQGGASALLQIELEKPHGMSAWTIGEIVGRQDVVGNTEAVLLYGGPARATVQWDHQYRDSQFTQELTLYDGIPRIDINTVADWQELGSWEKPAPMLKMAFPTMHTSPSAAFEIPYGSIDRPTDGREQPALRWVDISQNNYGVSLLNDCKYGFDVKDGTIRMTLLRSSYEPDATPDQGVHSINCSLYPHRGDWKKANTIRRGYEVNEPLLARVSTPHSGSLLSSESFLSVSEPNVVVSALKEAEDENAIILRIYESQGQPCQTAVRVGFPAAYYIETDLMENEIGQKTPITGSRFTINVGKHEIKTIKLMRR